MPSSSPRPAVVLWTVLTCQLMVVLDATVVNIAIPDIRHDLHLSPAGLSWIINAYALTFGGLLLLGARIGDILGHRVAFLGGIALFTLASLLGGAAQNSGELLSARAIQGIGAALASPTALAILMTTYVEGRERTRAVGLYTAVSIGGGALGLILGGMLTQWASWRWVLFINVPIGAVLLVAARRVIVGRARTPGKFDLPGALASTLGLSTLTFGLVHSAQHGWGNATAIISMALGLALIGLFVVVERTAVSPITPLRLFADRNRASAYFARLLLVAGMQGMFFYLTQFMQNVLGYSPLATGLGFLPITVMVFGSSQVASRYALERLGARRLLIVGMASSTLALVWLSQLSAHSSYTQVVGPLILVGFGNGTAFVPLTSIALSGVRREDAGAGAGLVNAMQQTGGAIGLAVLVTVSGSLSRSYVSGPHPGISVQELTNRAFIHGADGAFAAAAGFLFLCLLVVGLVIRSVPRDSSLVEAEEVPSPEIIAAP